MHSTNPLNREVDQNAIPIISTRNIITVTTRPKVELLLFVFNRVVSCDKITIYHAVQPIRENNFTRHGVV